MTAAKVMRLIKKKARGLEDNDLRYIIWLNYILVVEKDIYKIT